MQNTLRQAGAIPYKVDSDGLRVLLVTSRGTGRWVIPKGGIEKGYSAAKAAVQEAYEEAGIKGTIGKAPLGTFTYPKRLVSGRIRTAAVQVYALRFEKQLKKWPEQAERTYEWMTIPQAIAVVQEPGLAKLLRRLDELLGAKPEAAAG